MRKKYLSALLFGALLFASTGTFTSCKDYDDDIDNLQQQIDGLATKDDMQAKLDQMQTAVNDAKATAEEALEKANAAGDADKIAELEGRIADLEETLGDIDAMKEEIQNALDSQIADFREEMKELLKQVEELTGYSLGMVTEISFQVMNNTSEDKEKAYDPNLDVNYARISKITYPDGLAVNGSTETATSFVFGEGKTGAFTIKEGDVNTVTDHMLVNINPANAAISNDMLSLVNADGVNLNEYINLTSEPWSGEIIKTRSTQTTGLRMVGVQLKNDVDFEAFDKLVLPDVEGAHATDPNNCSGNHNYIAYALAVTDTEKNRSVTSSYDVTLHVQAEKPAEDINLYSTISSNASEEFAIDMYKNGEDAASGNEGCYPVEIAQPFQINVNSAYPTRGGRVMASYVTVDIDNHKLSTTDKAAIKALNFSGVDVVSTSDVHELSISGTYAAGIAIPLKLVTIDYTGNIKVNVVWVKAGQAAMLTASYSLTPKAYVNNPTQWTNENELIATDLQEFTIPANTASYSISLVAGEDDHVTYGRYPSIFETATTKAFTTFTSELKDDNNNEFLTLYKDKNLNKATKISEVAYAAFTGKLNLQLMREGTTYEGTIKFYDASGTYLGANTIQVTKVIPTAVPSDFSAKTNGIVDGVMTVYPEPVNGNPITGSYSLYQAFNNWENHYELNIDGIFTKNGDYDAGTGKGDNSTAKIESINVDVINDGKTYATTIGYNYGNILFIPEGHGVEDPNPCIVPWATNFDIKFGCWPVDCTYQWSETPVVYYRETNIIKGKVTKSDNTITAFENVIKATSPYKGVVDPFDATDEDWTTWANAFNVDGKQNVTIILKTTNESGQVVENEYFTAEFVTVNEKGEETTSSAWLKNAMKLTPTGTQVRVGNDVETQVVLRITDKFGHEHDIPALTFTMKINHE